MSSPSQGPGTRRSGRGARGAARLAVRPSPVSPIDEGSIVQTTSRRRDVYLELRFSPTVEIISVVRRFVSSFYERLLLDADATSRVALATHELLENACKYSVDGETLIRIDLDAPRARVRIRLTNRTTPEHLANLEGRFALMAQFPDPADYYRHTMAATIHRNDGSGLGLARIRAEADMELALQVDGDLLSILAVTTVAGPAADGPPSAGATPDR